MTETRELEAGEKSVAELLEVLTDDVRVVLQTEFLGSEHEVTLRYDGEIYYCDTPTRLHKHDSDDEMRECLREHGYARPDD